MKYLVLDFESRSNVDLSEASYRRYATHPTTDILCIGLKWNDRPASVFVPVTGPVLDGRTRPTELMEAISQGCPIVVHNVSFEKRMYYWICHKRFGWPEIPDTQWVDTMASCAYFAIPRSLAKAAKALDLTMQKDTEAGRDLDEGDGDEGVKKGKGRHVLTQVTKPRKHGKLAIAKWVATGEPVEKMPLIWWEDSVRLEKLYEYCRDDVDTQAELFEKLGPLPAVRWREWRTDEKVNERGVPVDWGALYEASRVVEQSMASYNTRIIELTKTPAYPNGMVQSISQVKKILDWCELKGYVMVSLNKASVEAALAVPGLPAPVREILTIRQDSGKSSLGKLQTMMDLTDDDWRIRDSMVWHGAATGRKAGRGMQPHNFPRDCMDHKDAEEFHKMLQSDDPYGNISFHYQSDLMTNEPRSLPDVISSALRSFIRPEQGKKLLISDLSNIETRNLAWLSDCQLLLDAFSNGKCPYRQFASRIYNVRADDIAKGSQERQMGKVAVLGLGYQMGGPKFVVTAAGPPYNITLSEERSKEIVNLYRTTYPEVPRMWRDTEAAMMEAIQTQSTIQCGKVFFGASANWAWIVLPSGRYIWFNSPKIIRVDDRFREGKTKLQISYMGIDSKTKQWVRRSTYGGSIVESISQAMAGCLLQEIITRCDSSGFPVILSVHDEVVCEVDENVPLDPFHQLVKVRPAWCLDLPIECESHESTRYGK